jgi:hypothetical protein
MKYALIVLFHLGGPQPQFVDGFLPLFFNTYEECEARRVEATAYFETQTSFPPFEMNCYSREKQGTKANETF